MTLPSLENAAKHAPYLRELQSAVGENSQPLSMPVSVGDLQEFRNRHDLLLGEAELTNSQSLDEMLASLSQSAEVAAGVAFDAAINASTGKGQLEDGSGLFLLALGKLGGEELNYASDIDLISFFDPDTVKPGAKLKEGDVARAAVNITKQFVAFLHGDDPQSYGRQLWRVDLRLRPDPASTPLSISTTRAVRYYREAGRTWERAAFTKARFVAGDKQAAQRFLHILEPFIWRNVVDYHASFEIWQMRENIRSSHPTAKLETLSKLGSPRGFNAKLGSGSIREIEFFVTAHQLIHGGRNHDMRHRSTRMGLRHLFDAGFIDEGKFADLDDAYRFLRHLEHRLQIHRGQQTQTIPAEADRFEEVLGALGFDDEEGLDKALRPHRQAIRKHYDDYFDRFARSDAVPVSSPKDAANDFNAKEQEVIEKWRGYTFAQHPYAQSLLSTVVDRLRSKKTKLSRLDLIKGMDQLFGALNRGIGVLGALALEPKAFDHLIKIIETAPRFLGFLRDNPTAAERLGDKLIDARPSSLNERRNQLRLALNQSVLHRDWQAALDITRRWTRDARTMTALRLLNTNDRQAPESAMQSFSDIADASVIELAHATAAAFEDAHGRLPGVGTHAALLGLGIVALGKLGRRELSFSSDLDLVFVHPDLSLEAVSNGRRPLPMAVYYARLAKRITTAISSVTAEGRLYEIDTRLRPNGAKGVTAINLNGYQRYLLENAWTFEIIALQSARVLTATTALKTQLEALFEAVATRSIDPQKARYDVAKMIHRLRDAHRGEPGDIKWGEGGLIAIDLAQGYQRLVGDDPSIDDAVRKRLLHVQQVDRIQGQTQTAMARDGVVEDRAQMARFVQSTIFDGLDEAALANHIERPAFG